jgi:hypothetical protein
MASNLTGINKQPLVANDTSVNTKKSQSPDTNHVSSKTQGGGKTPDVVINISRPPVISTKEQKVALPPGVEIRGGPYMPQSNPIIPVKGPKPINPKDDPSIKVPEPPKNTQPVSYPKPIAGKDDPYVKKIIDNPPKYSPPQQAIRDDKKLGLYDPYKDLYTVQGWNTAFKTHGVGVKESSPYYAAAHQGQTIHDANGNFMLNQNLGTEVTKGYTKYKLASQDNVDGKTVYTYIKSGNV